MNSAVDSAHPRPRHPRRGGVLSGFLIGFCVSAAATVLLGVVIGTLLENKTDARTPEEQVADQVDRLLAAVADGTYADAYQKMCSPQLRENAPPRLWKEICEGWKNEFGALKSKKKIGYQRADRKDLYVVNASYSAEFEKGPAHIEVQLQRIDKIWVFEGILVRKPADDKDKKKADDKDKKK